MAQKFRGDVRSDVDIRPGGGFEDSRNSNTNYSGGATKYPGFGGPDESLRYGGVPPMNNSIRNVRSGNIANFGAGDLGPMEIAGKTVTPTKVPPMQKFDSRPITGPGPLEEQRLTQQQNNAIAMGDPDYSPFRELDYESIKDANFSRPSQKSARRPDKDFGR